jgi:hypothetical protein
LQITKTIFFKFHHQNLMSHLKYLIAICKSANPKDDVTPNNKTHFISYQFCIFGKSSYALWHKIVKCFTLIELMLYGIKMTCLKRLMTGLHLQCQCTAFSRSRRFSHFCHLVHHDPDSCNCYHAFHVCLACSLDL